MRYGSSQVVNTNHTTTSDNDQVSSSTTEATSNKDGENKEKGGCFIKRIYTVELPEGWVKCDDENGEDDGGGEKDEAEKGKKRKEKNRKRKLKKKKSKKMKIAKSIEFTCDDVTG